jgi:Gpi18-like mannosyltransferase
MQKKRLKSYLPLFIIFLLGTLIRLFLTRFGNNSGDLLVFAEWGKRFWEVGTRNFYTDKLWYYSFPTYPPLSSLMYGGLYWLFEHNYVLAQIHNVIKIIPSAFILYFNELLFNPLNFRQGYFLLLKLPAILGDIGITAIIYWGVLKLAKDKKKALLASAFYFLNPMTVFLSSVWGQTESLVAFFGLLSFLLIDKKAWLSIPLLLICLLIKPTWVVFGPLYIFLLFVKKVKLKQLGLGLALSLLIFIITTYPFSGRNILPFAWETVIKNILPSAKGLARASVSAINFYSIFFKIGIDVAKVKLLGIPLDLIGVLAYVLLNLLAFTYVKKQKNFLLSVFSSLFLIGLGSFLFLTNMLERYFFASFTPMVVLMLVNPKTFLNGVLVNVVVLANLVWMFYRRRFFEIDRPFVNNNFLLVRILSILIVVSWYFFSRELSLFQPGLDTIRRKLKD